MADIGRVKIFYAPKNICQFLILLYESRPGSPPGVFFCKDLKLHNLHGREISSEKGRMIYECRNNHTEANDRDP